MNNTTIAPNTPNLANVDLPLAVHALMSVHGQMVRIVMARPVKYLKKAIVAETIKTSAMTVRIGVNYDNQKAVIEKRADGTLPEENQGLIGREWIVFPYIMRTTKSGKYLVRCTPINGNDFCKPTVTFTRNGVEITREEASKDALASEFGEREPTDAFDITVDNILSINGKDVV